MDLEEGWVNEWPSGLGDDVVEPPPEGFYEIADRERPVCLEDPETGTRREVVGATEFEAYRKRGWKWVLRRDIILRCFICRLGTFKFVTFPG